MDAASAYAKMLQKLKELGVEDVLRTGKGAERISPQPGLGPETEDERRLLHGQSALIDDFLHRGGSKDAPALQEYRTLGYHGINSRLRGDPSYTERQDKKRSIDMLEELLLSGVDLPYDIKVHRGLGRNPAVFERNKPGDEVGNLAFLSTSVDPRIAADFTSMDNPLMAELEIPAGTRFIPLPGSERELLFGPRNTFEIQDLVGRADSNKGRLMKARLIPGKKWNSETSPRSKLIGGGALGAFLTGMEDEPE